MEIKKDNKIINDIDNEVFFDELYKDEINYLENNKNIVLEKNKEHEKKKSII